MEIKTITLATFLLILLSLLQVKSADDLTLQPETNGTLVVQACLAKISQSSVFSRNDQQMLRRIAYVETHDGTDADTYAKTSNGGIWQLSEAKYTATKNTGSNTQLQQQVQGISSNFSINWLTTQWVDLRKPFYSALAARLYMQVITASIPLASNVSSQGNYWANYYTSSGGNQSQYVSAVNQLQSIEDCDVSALDLFFVMDASGSVGYSNFQTMKTFVRDIANSFEIGPNDVQIGVMSYGSLNTFHFYLNTYSTKFAVLSAISTLPYSRGGTKTALALNAVRITGFSQFNGARPASEGIPRVAIVITDGYSRNYSATVTAANALHNAGIIAFAIGIAGANQNELNAIASQASYVSFISSFNVAQLSALQISISQEACVASSDLSIDQVVSDTIDQGQTKYINYPLPSNDKGITIVLNVSNGSVVLYASTIVSTPSEVFHDVKIESSQFEDVYIDPDKITNPDTADTVYIAIEGQGVSNMMQVSASQEDISTEPVAVSKLPDIVSEYYGQTLSIQCTVRGKPQPTITWYRKSVVINSLTYPDIQITTTAKDNTTVQSGITITSVTDTDEGIYTCSGSNTLPNGTVTNVRSFTLKVTGIIAINFTGIALSSTAIYLSWSLPPVQGVNIQHFIIEIDELETSRDWTFYVVETHATVISLHPYYTYVCKVAAVENMTYPYTSPITVITHQAAPTSYPQNPMHHVISSTTLNLTWYPPPISQQNGIINYYIIQSTEVEAGITHQYTSNNAWIYLTNLHAYYSYIFKFAAVTIAQGPFSAGTTITMPEDVPSSPPTNASVSIRNSRSIFITWFPPPFDHQNGLIREYEIIIEEIETGMIYNDTSLNLYIQIDYIHPHYNYNISISAVTIASGPYSTAITIQTPQDSPSGSPDNFNATVTSPYSAVLTWAPPSPDQRNGIIIGYIINVTILETNETFLLFSNTTSLTVNGLRPFSNYVCIIAAQTSVGIGPYSAVFTVTTPQDAPSAPPSMTLTSSITSNGFTITWNPPGYNDQNGVIIYYNLSIVEVQTGSIFQYISYTTTITIQSLHPAYTYQYRIAAYTIGLGPYSDPINITTAEEAPSQAPQSLSGVASSSTSITLSWSPPLPEYRNGLIISYYVNITLLETGTSVYYYTAHTTFTISGLTPYTTYSCIVAAETSIGRGPFTTLFTITTQEDAPNSPPVITGYYAFDSRTVAFQWDPPPPQEHNGIIREYIVTTSVLGSNETQTQIFTGTTAIIGSLIPSFTYQFTVAAYTLATGPYSTSVNITLPEDVPSGIPQDVSLNNVTPYSISLMWTPPPPSQQNGAIVGYIVNLTHANTLETIQYYSIVTNVAITGLDPYTTYICVVAAETTIGVGPFSQLFFEKTKEAAPASPPQHPNAVALSPTSIHITWDPPILQDHNGVIREYRINITEALTGLQLQEITNQTQIIIDRLKPYHIYHCSIVAITVASGPFTKTFNITTLQDATSGTNCTQRGHVRNTTLLISIPVGSVLAIIIVLVILVLCIVRTIKRNKNKKQNLIYDEPVNVLALNQLSSHDTNPTVPMRSFTLREDVRTAENEYDIGPTQVNYTNEIEDSKLTDDRNKHDECHDKDAEEEMS